MSTTNTPAVFDGCRAEIADLIEVGAAMDAIEQTIDACALDGEEKDALWLWARGRHDWLSSDRFDRRTIGRRARDELLGE